MSFFGDASVTTIIAAFVYAVYFKKVVALNEPIGDFYWSAAINISMIIAALLSPLLGAAADYYNNKKNYLSVFTLLCVISTGLLFFAGEGMIFYGMYLFILANIGFQAGLGFYDGFLKEITPAENYNKVSSLGYAVGYLGSLLSLAVIIILKDEPKYTFIACSVLFTVFSLPLFLLIKENRRAPHASKTVNGRA